MGIKLILHLCFFKQLLKNHAEIRNIFFIFWKKERRSWTLVYDKRKYHLYHLMNYLKMSKKWKSESYDVNNRF